jgi:hypothetical protein
VPWKRHEVHFRTGGAPSGLPFAASHARRIVAAMPRAATTDSFFSKLPAVSSTAVQEKSARTLGSSAKDMFFPVSSISR